jgi:hypothetical protein
MDLESGDQARRPPSGPGHVVSLRAADPAFGRHHKHIGVVAAVGVGILIAHKSDPCAVGDQTASSSCYVLRRGQLLGLFRRQVVEVERVPGVVAQIALDVLLEVVAIDDDGLGRRGRLAFLGVRLGLGMEGEQQLFSVRRPAVALDLLVCDTVSCSASPPRRSRTHTCVPLAVPGREDRKLI